MWYNCQSNVILCWSGQLRVVILVVKREYICYKKITLICLIEFKGSPLEHGPFLVGSRLVAFSYFNIFLGVEWFGFFVLLFGFLVVG